MLIIEQLDAALDSEFSGERYVYENVREPASAKKGHFHPVAAIAHFTTDRSNERGAVRMGMFFPRKWLETMDEDELLFVVRNDLDELYDKKRKDN